MTRGQLAALFLIGGVVLLAYLQSYKVAQYLKLQDADPSQGKETPV